MNGTKGNCDTSRRFNIQILGITLRKSRKFEGKAFTREITKQFPKSEAHKFLF